MKKLLFLTVAAGMSAALTAAIYGDTPDAKHAWAAHDRNRPNPLKVTANPGGIPSDAIILFDGSKASFEKKLVLGKGSDKKHMEVCRWRNGIR